MLDGGQLVRDQIDGILAALIATGGPYDPAGLWVGVYQSIVDNGIETVMADVTAPTGAAATRQAVTWGTPYQLTDGSAVVDSTAKIFRPTGSETGVAAGAYLADALTSGNLLQYFRENDPANIDASHPYTVILRLVVDPAGRWSLSFGWDG